MTGPGPATIPAMPAEVLWKEKEDLYFLMKKRAEIGAAAFEAEYQGNPVDPSAAEWPPEYLDWPGLFFDQWPEKLALKVMAIDPSKGKDSRHGDYSAIVSYGRTAEELEYAEADLARRPVDAICADAARIAAAFRPDLLVVEANGFQELLSVPLLAALRKEKAEVLVEGMVNSANKQVRIRRLTVPLARRKLRFKARSPGTMMMVQQLRDFPNGSHDDGPDALEMARRAAIDLNNNGPRKRPR